MREEGQERQQECGQDPAGPRARAGPRPLLRARHSRAQRLGGGLGGWAALVRHFDPKQVAPLTLVVESPAPATSLRSTDGIDALYQLTKLLDARPGVARVWSATRPTGEGEPLAPATLGSQLARLREGLGLAGAGAGELAAGLATARREVERGRSELATRESEVEAEQERSLLGAFAPGRFEAARRELGELEAKLGELEAGVRSGGLGADALREGIARIEARLHALGTAPGTARLLDRLALLPDDVAGRPELAHLVRADRARLDLWIVAGVFVQLVVLLHDLAAPLAITAFILASYLAALGALRALADAGLWAGVDWKAPCFLFVLLVAIGADYGIFVLGPRARGVAQPSVRRGRGARGGGDGAGGVVLRSRARGNLRRARGLARGVPGAGGDRHHDRGADRYPPRAALPAAGDGRAPAPAAAGSPQVIRAALLALSILLAARTDAGAEHTLVLDPGRSEIRFSLGATLHTVHGALDLVRGELRFGPEGGAVSGEILVDARSARTGIDARDREMHGKVLESARFPEISLHAERLEVLRRDAASADVRLHGTLEIHGGAHAVAIPATVRAAADDRLVVEARFRVPYVEWGMRDVSNLVLRVAKDVEVSVRAEGRVSNR